MPVQSGDIGLVTLADYNKHKSNENSEKHITAGMIEKLDALSGQYVVIAASNSTNTDKAKANVVCDGTADEEQINAAIVSLTEGGYVLLLGGDYVCGGADNAPVITVASGVTLCGVGKTSVLSFPEWDYEEGAKNPAAAIKLLTDSKLAGLKMVYAPAFTNWDMTGYPGILIAGDNVFVQYLYLNGWYSAVSIGAYPAYLSNITLDHIFTDAYTGIDCMRARYVRLLNSTISVRTTLDFPVALYANQCDYLTAVNVDFDCSSFAKVNITGEAVKILACRVLAKTENITSTDGIISNCHFVDGEIVCLTGSGLKIYGNHFEGLLNMVSVTGEKLHFFDNDFADMTAEFNCTLSHIHNNHFTSVILNPGWRNICSCNIYDGDFEDNDNSNDGASSNIKVNNSPSI